MKIDDEKSRLIKELFRLSAIGMELALSIVIGLGLGILVDRWLSTSPWGMMAFLS